MSTTKITSEILKIESPIRDVYALLSDFSRIGRLVEMAKQMGMTNGLEMDKISEKIESTRFTEDACYITLKGMGELAVDVSILPAGVYMVETNDRSGGIEFTKVLKNN